MLDFAELWRKSNCFMFQLLRNPEKFDTERYNYWFENYFQVCLAVFLQKALLQITK